MSTALLSTTNLKTTGTQTVAVDGLTTAGLEASLAAVGGEFPEAGASTAFDGFATVSTEGSDATISVAHSGGLKFVDPDSTAVIVEVCYYVTAPAPDSDDISLCPIRLKPVLATDLKQIIKSPSFGALFL